LIVGRVLGEDGFILIPSEGGSLDDKRVIESTKFLNAFRLIQPEVFLRGRKIHSDLLGFHWGVLKWIHDGLSLDLLPCVESRV
jgi:hypothetical protein